MLLATDPDREGESISWHLREVLKPKVPVKRIVFHEITKEAINEALAHAHDVEREPGARAGEPPHSRPPVRLHAVAGAVEEGADRTERRARAERGRAADRGARGRAPRVPHGARTGTSRRRLDGRRAGVRRHARRASATSASRPARTSTPDRRAEDAERARCSRGRRRRAGRGARAQLPWTVTVGRSRSPASAAGPALHDVDADAGSQPQAGVLDRADDAGRRSGCSRASRRGGEMEGHISYHRTDSTTLSRQGAGEVGARHPRDVRRGVLRGAAPVPDAREERAGGARGDSADRLPPRAAASSRACSIPTSCSVYELIWKRTMASQMVDARVLRTAVEITATGAGRRAAVFTASGKAIEFAGFRRAYVEGSDDPAAELEEQEAHPAAVQGGRSHRSHRGSATRGCTLAAASTRSATRRRPRRDSRRRRSSRNWSGWGSAVPRPTRRRSPRSSAAATSSARARRSCRASRRLR